MCCSRLVCPVCVPVVNAYQYVTPDCVLYFVVEVLELRHDDWMFGGWMIIEWTHQMLGKLLLVTLV